MRLDESYLPAYDAVEYELRKFSRARWMTPWHGPPSDAVDDAWEALYSSSRCIEDPKERLREDAHRTVAISGDEENCVIALDVFHQLHCLNMVRKALAPDYCPMSRISDGFDHVDHCVNSLRDSLVCSVDITPNTWIWSPDARNGMGGTSPRLDNMHTCRDSDKVRDWAKAREMDGDPDTTVYVEDDLWVGIIY